MNQSYKLNYFLYILFNIAKLRMNLLQSVPFEISKPKNYEKSHMEPILCINFQEIIVNLLKFHFHKQQKSLYHNKTNQTSYFSSSTINLSIIFSFTQINLVKVQFLI